MITTYLRMFSDEGRVNALANGKSVSASLNMQHECDLPSLQ
jgi:hypothetical protein